MNCSDVQQMLNDAARANLSGAEREKLHAHLAGCAVCDAEWRAQQLLAAAPVVPPSIDLRTLAQQALRAPSASARRTGARPFVLLTGVALVGAAAWAAWVGLSLEQADDAGTAAPTSLVGEGPTGVMPAATDRNETAAASAAPVPAAGNVEPAADAPAIALDRSWIAVLPLPSNYADRDVLAKVDELRAEVVDRIGAMEGLHVFDLARLQAYVDAGMTDVEIGRALGAGVVLFPKVTRGPRGNVLIDFSKLDPATEQELGGATFTLLIGGSTATEAQIQNFEKENALLWDNNLSAILNVVFREAFPELMPSSEQLAAENRQVLFDTGRSEAERLEALQYFSFDLGGANEGVADIVDAGIGLLESSSSTQIRTGVLTTFASLDDPRLVETLRRLLAYDTSPEVRTLSARILARFSDDAGIREALELAAMNDPTPAVRDAAAVAKLPAPERMQHRRNVFFDEDLTPITRMLELDIGVGASYGDPPVEIDQEIARELVDIAVNGPSADDRAMALTILFYVGSEFPDFEPDAALRLPLLDVLENHPEQGTRGAAAHALRIFANEPDVRAALENARDLSPDRLTRNAAARALELAP